MLKFKTRITGIQGPGHYDQMPIRILDPWFAFLDFLFGWAHVFPSSLLVFVSDCFALCMPCVRSASNVTSGGSCQPWCSTKTKLSCAVRRLLYCFIKNETSLAQPWPPKSDNDRF